MKKSVSYLLPLFCCLLLSGLLSCNSFLWDPTGEWTFAITLEDQTSWEETITLSGDAASGKARGFTNAGWDKEAGVGAYSVTDLSIQIEFDYYSLWWLGDHAWIFSGTSAQDNPNDMKGTGTWTLEGLGDIAFSFTAAKTSNLQ